MGKTMGEAPGEAMTGPAATHSAPDAAVGRWQHAYTLRLVLYTGLWVGFLGATAWAAWPPMLPATATVAAGLAALALAALVRHIRRTNLELARLADALAHGDLGQTFMPRHPDAGFGELAASFEALLGRLRGREQQAVREAALWRTLVEQVPTPLLRVRGEGPEASVELLNAAARRLLSPAPGPRLADHAAFGTAWVTALRSAAPSIAVDLQPQDDARLRVRLHQTVFHGGDEAERLVAVTPLQGDLDAAQLALSSDLLRVLTHEVMNALTPVTSLAASAAQAAQALPDRPEHTRLREAIAVVARRAEGLGTFVARYRELTETPKAVRQVLDIAALVREQQLLFDAQWAARGLELQTHVDPALGPLEADPGLLAQALQNLLRNAAQAVLERPLPGIAPVVQLRAAPHAQRGSATGRHRQRPGHSGRAGGRCVPAVLHHPCRRQRHRPHAGAADRHRARRLAAVRAGGARRHLPASGAARGGAGPEPEALISRLSTSAGSRAR
jgi:two-component system nitrogen regulation sensor histidine kinase NtrY